MLPEDKDLLARVAPAYICAGIALVASIVQIRSLNRQRKATAAEHEIRMANLMETGKQSRVRYEAWRATQPNNVDEYIAAARKETPLDEVRRKMEDPNHIWVL